MGRYLKPVGRLLAYVYRQKGPDREYTDDYVGQKLREMSIATR